MHFKSHFTGKEIVRVTPGPTSDQDPLILVFGASEMKLLHSGELFSMVLDWRAASSILNLAIISFHNTVYTLPAELADLEIANVDPDLFDLTKDQNLDQLQNYNFTNLPFRYTLHYIQK